MKIIRLFLSYGEDPGALDQCGWSLMALFNIETSWKWASKGKDLPSLWLLEDILPSTNPHIYAPSKKLWKDCLYFSLWNSTHSPDLRIYRTRRIIEHCDLTTVRWAFVQWVLGFCGRPGLGSAFQSMFELLLEESGGPHFVIENGDDNYTPLSAAIQTSESFSYFKILLEKSPWPLQDFIQGELSCHPDGWNERTLWTLFTAETAVYCQPRNGEPCKLCKKWLCTLVEWWEYPWQRTIQRIKDGIPFGVLLNHEELACNAAWEETIKAFIDGVCFACIKTQNEVAREHCRMMEWNGYYAI